MTDDGSTEADYYATFDDEAPAPCSTICANTSCNAASAPGPTCKPDDPLSAFDPFTTPGTFTLVFCDDGLGDLGTLVSWAVTADGLPDLPVELMAFDVQ